MLDPNDPRCAYCGEQLAPDFVPYHLVYGYCRVECRVRHVSGFGELSWWFSSDYLWLPGRTDYHTKDECLRKCRKEVMEKFGMEEVTS